MSSRNVFWEPKHQQNSSQLSKRNAKKDWKLLLHCGCKCITRLLNTFLLFLKTNQHWGMSSSYINFIHNTLVELPTAHNLHYFFLVLAGESLYILSKSCYWSVMGISPFNSYCCLLCFPNKPVVHFSKLSVFFAFIYSCFSVSANLLNI